MCRYHIGIYAVLSMAKTVEVGHAEFHRNECGSVMSFLVRLALYIWRTLCLIYTRLRWASLSSKPALLLHYETPAQQQAYVHLHESWADRGGGRRTGKLKVSCRILVIIPFRDRWDLTATCLATLKQQELSHAEVLVALVDNGSTDQATKIGLEKLLAEEQSPNLKFALKRYDIPFNYSQLNNLAVRDFADFGAEYYLLLNNDVFFTDPRTILTMADFLSSNDNAASLGCSLLYPDQRIQHLFIFVGSKIVGAHPFKGRYLDLSDPWCQKPRPVGAATAALLLVRASDFAKVGGFDENLPSCYQDVDLALKLLDLGQTNWVLPFISAIHAETQTRRPDHHWSEVRYMQDKWGEKLLSNVYISPKFSRWSEQIVLALGEGQYPWHLLEAVAKGE